MLSIINLQTERQNFKNKIIFALQNANLASSVFFNQPSCI
jgi:hypothetical protein